MATNYKAYPAYKDSGVEWLGEVPEHWEVLPLKRNFKIINGSTPKSSEETYWEGNIIWITPADLSKVTKYISNSAKKITLAGLNSCGTSIIPKNSLILSTRAPIGTLAINTKELCTNQGCKSLVTKNHYTDIKFIYYILSISSNELNNLGKGTTFLELSSDELANYNVPQLPFAEQQKIADFLDYETTKIDTLINKQEKLIELLKEKRQAVISHAVTKGLDPNVPMKDSGVEWLGEVPESWLITPVKRVAELTPKKTNIKINHNEKCTFVPMEKLKQDNLVTDIQKTIKSVYDGYTYFENEDILLAKVTPCFENKNMVVARGLYNGIGFGSSEIYVLRCNQNIINDFLYYRLQEDTFMNIAISTMTGAGGLKRVPGDTINNFLIAIPTIQEQINIIDFLKKQLIIFDNLISKAEQAIKLIKERKTALISAAVTGKIDVRDWQKPKDNN